MAQRVKNQSACNAGHLGSIPGLGNPWRRAWQPTPVLLPRKSPWTEEPGGLQSTESWRVGYAWVTKRTEHNCFIRCVSFHCTTMWISHNHIWLPPSWASLPSHSPQRGYHRAPGLTPCVTQHLPVAMYFPHGSVYMLTLLSPCSPRPAVSTCLFSTFTFLLCKCVRLHHFSRFHHISRFYMYALTCYVCFNLSDLLHSF